MRLALSRTEENHAHFREGTKVKVVAGRREDKAAGVTVLTGVSVGLASASRVGLAVGAASQRLTAKPIVSPTD